jgi:hypothetical protein
VPVPPHRKLSERALLYTTLASENRTLGQIAAITGVSKQTVSHVLRYYGLRATGNRPYLRRRVVGRLGQR